jgi:hypothetical protein
LGTEEQVGETRGEAKVQEVEVTESKRRRRTHLRELQTS